MAAIGRRRFLQLCAATLAATLPSFAATEDRQSELRAAIARVATALSAGNPADALEPFSKSFENYEQLRDYFTALTSSYNIVNEAEVMNEEDTSGESRLAVTWSMTLNGKAEEPGRQRSAELQLRFVREKNKWKIAGLTPLSFFDPASP